MENIVAVAVRDWIGVMNSEKKYRQKNMSGISSKEPDKDTRRVFTRKSE